VARGTAEIDRFDDETSKFVIGVIAKHEDESSVAEFFELFKTPWEVHRPGRKYKVILCCGELKRRDIDADVLLLYSSEKLDFDAERKIQIQSRQKQPKFSYGGKSLPIYDYGATFGGADFIAYADPNQNQTIIRVGYDLFREVRFLLTEGQPEESAASPALDLHIALLRDLITGSGISLVEIPPVPDGYPFVACMTHDVDHASLRRHKFDHTMLGFLYRSTVGSARDVARGRMSAAKLWTNCVAAAKLPLVYAGLARDPWLGFDRYTEIENGKPSTFFFIPFERRPGSSKAKDGEAPSSRGSRYDVSHVATRIPKLLAAGCEIGLHGIDAWSESSKGRVESERIAQFSGDKEMGVRMHWLYWNENSPSELEAAGFSYDSTCGFNGAVGYRAGTSQVFKPLMAKRILELPLHVMDTALFYPDHMNLPQSEAWKFMTPLIQHAESNGGTLTVNWHDRSIAPERLWGDFYVEMLQRLEARRPWFSTAMQAVSWFRKRRAAVFENSKITSLEGDGLPNLRLRIHQQRKDRNLPETHRDTGFQGCIEVTT
jgi:hypothetical protein